jgi:D-threo-aldose 1-dehydrogenase
MYLHDPEYHVTLPQAMAKNGPVEALVQLRDAGVLEHLGIAAGPVQLSRDFIATGVFEVVLSHNRFTLLDRSAEPLMNDAYQLGIAYINAAPYGGGILAKGPELQPKYAYRSTDETILDAVRRMQSACAQFGVPLSAAALQFSMREPRVTSTVVGVSRPARVAAIEELASRVIPDELWTELDSLAPSSEHWLN